MVWIDAVGIDQANIPERNAQVSIMSQIYKSASQVVLDLGKATAEVEPGIRYLQEIARRNPATDVMSPHQEGRPLAVVGPKYPPPAWHSGGKSPEADKQFFMGAMKARKVAAFWVDEDGKCIP